jgi:hypothetical protein
MQLLTGEPVTDPREVARIIARIIRETQRWDQSHWFSSAWFSEGHEVSVSAARQSLNKGCGSTGCAAGWATILHAPDGSRIDDSDNIILPDGHRVYAEVYGQEALGLDNDQGYYLFSGYRTEHEVLTALDAIAAGEEWDSEEFGGE